MENDRQRPGARSMGSGYFGENARYQENENHLYRTHCQYGRREVNDYDAPGYSRPDFGSRRIMPEEEVRRYLAGPRQDEGVDVLQYEDCLNTDEDDRYYSRDNASYSHPNRRNYAAADRYQGEDRYNDHRQAYYDRSDRRGPSQPYLPGPPQSQAPARFAVPNEQIDETVDESLEVEFVHHDSPVGPAVSVYPKGYLRSQPTLPKVPPRAGVAERRRGFESAETAKIAEYERQGRSSVRPSVPMIEICPGVFSRLRGASETKECIRRDFFMPTVCFSCNLEQFCIQDAFYVLCPKCRVVNPLSGFDLDCRNKEDGGVGLGFTMEDLESLQTELIQERRRATSIGYRR